MSTRSLVLLALLAIGIGIVLRFAEIDRKIFWFNEVFTALRLSCEFETRGQFPELMDAGPIRPSTLRAYQVPDAEDGYLCIVRSLAAKDRLHPPLYYFAARGWVDLVGFSTEKLRILSAIFGVALIGAAGWLGREVFRDGRAGWAMAGLVAVSPIFIRYAQEARSYTLWLVFAVLAFVFFLRALRSDDWRNWSICLLFLVIAAWTHLLTLALLASFALFLILRDGPRVTRDAIRLAIVGGATLLLISPWLLQLALHLARRGGAASHLTFGLEPGFLLNAFGQNLGHVLLSWPAENSLATAVTLIFLAVLVGMALRRLWIGGQRTTLLLLVALALPCLAITVFADFTLSGQRSLRARYVFPLFIAMLLALAFLISRASAQGFKHRLLPLAILSLGAFSGVHAVLSPTWWDLSKVDRQLLAVLEDEPNTLIVTDVVYGVVAPLSHRLSEDTAFLMLSQPIAPARPEGFARHLLYQPSPELYDAIARRIGHAPELVFETPRRDAIIYRLYTLPVGD
ncbi:MAG: glycosyltransferase family 39 protein [Pseudomonadota bacterium]